MVHMKKFVDDFSMFFHLVTSLFHNLADLPFLMGQALWCSSRYVTALSPNHMNT